MNFEQREAALRLADELWDINMDEEAALLRELAAEPAQEPVAWAVYTSDEFMRVFDAEDDAVRWHQQETSNGSPYTYRVVPLYAAPPQRQPLTDEQAFASRDIMDINGRLLGMPMVKLMEVVRAVELAHGIGE